MKLWKIEWDEVYPDEIGLIIIRAESKEDAIELAKQESGYYKWLANRRKFDSRKWEIVELTIVGDTGIIAVG